MTVDEQPGYSTRPAVVGSPTVENAPALLAPGTMLDGRYRIEAELGRGAIGVVYLAHDEKLHDTKVVIKVLRERWDDNDQREYFEGKFKGEIKALALIDHPGVVRALDVGELPGDGRSYLVMQYVEGRNLRSQIEPQGMELARVANLIRQIGQALTAAHGKGVLHRDLKPENIMLQATDDEEYAKLIDFGIATVLEKLTPSGIQTTAVAGTVPYMAPEQLSGKPEAASDIYALGVVAYEMVTGRRPFNPDSPYQMLELQRVGIRVTPGDLRPGLPEGAQAAILKALAFEPQQRHNNAREFVDEFVRALTKHTGKTKVEGLHLAQVLFTDLVGYSKLTIEEASCMLDQLQEIVRRTVEFQRAQTNGQLISLPTGDGMALVFFGGDPMAAVKCAIEISRALKSHSDIKLRMGLHTGLVKVISDINNKPNVSGGGINIAQRVMDCGGAGHILLSRTVADDLNQLSEWSIHLRNCGERTVKHGLRLRIFNLYMGEVGRPDCPEIPVSGWRSLIGPLLTVAILSTIGWIYLAPLIRRPTPTPKPINMTKPRAVVPVRQLSYSLTAQRNLKRYPGSKPFSPPTEFVFEAGDQVRLRVSSPQAGHLYIINEGPRQINGLPAFNILFPSSTGGSSEVKSYEPIYIPQPSEKPELDWIFFDEQKGTEKLWLVWSERSVPELEWVNANPLNRGVISSKSQIESVARYLATHFESKPEVEKDEVTKQTKLKSNGDVLVGVMSLNHQ